MKRIALLTCLLFGFIQFAPGQVPPGAIPIGPTPFKPDSPDSNETASKPDEPARSTQSQTIMRAGQDLRHVEVGRRVGAAKLLGKYPGLQSTLLLILALDDKSPLVRRSAMVSLAEQASNGYLIYEKSLIEKIYSKLGDSDVEVRRVVTTMIPQLVRGLRGGVYGSVQPGMRPDLVRLTQKAFLDPDAIVRQNVLKYHLYIGVPLPVSTLEKLLADSDLGVLLTALGRIYSNANQLAIVNKIEALSTHPDRGIRLKVVSVARDANRYHVRYRSILRGMTNDKDPEVTSMAAVELARFGEKVPGAVIERIKNYLLGVEGMSSQVTTILYSISAMGKDAIQVYQALTGHSSSQIRKVAWQRYFNLSAGWNKPRLWMPAMEDRDKGVREVVLMSLRGRSIDLNEEDMRKLVESRYPDIRIFAGRLLLTSKKELVEEFGFDLLIDEDTVVRSTTIRAMASRKVPGWVNVMKRSLLDDDYVIQRAAMDGLLSDRAEGVLALRKFVSENPKNRISAMAMSELRVRGIQP
jgi:hypothetical protein